jgi:serine protease Do
VLRPASNARLVRLGVHGALFAAGVALGAAWARSPAPPAPAAPEVAVVELTAASAQPAVKTIDPAQVAQHSAPPSPAGDKPRALAPREIARRALDFTVYVRGGSVYGAGFVIDDAGHVLTCDHVVEGVKNLEVQFHGSDRRIPAKVIDRDKKLDLALLRIEGPLPAKAPLGSVLEVEMGDSVYGMGTPRKMGFSLSRGIVSYVGRSFDGTLYVQTDLATNSGSSGGPVLNRRGEVIGLSSFILRGSQGLSFAIPIDYAYSRFKSALAERDGSGFERWLHARRATVPAAGVEQSSPTGAR